MDFKTFFSILSPFITVFLGLLLIPIIESVKNRHERKKLLKSLQEELEDEKICLKRDFELIFNCYKGIEKRISSGKFDDNFLWINIGILQIFSIDRLLENHFEYMPAEVRQTIKHLKEAMEQQNSIKKDIEEFHSVIFKILENNREKVNIILDLQHNYMCGMLTHRYNICFLLSKLKHENTDYEIFYEVDFNKSLKQQLKEMKFEKCIETILHLDNKRYDL